MNIKTQKIGAGVLVGVVVIAGALSWWRYYRPYDITAGWSEVKSEGDMYRYARSLVTAYEKDTVGFDTPEETFDAFREALKAGDYKLASQYFVPEKQGEMLAFFLKAEQEDFIKQQVDLLYLEHQIIKSSTGDEITLIVNDGKGHRLGYDLVKNSYTHIWKMSDL